MYNTTDILAANIQQNSTETKLKHGVCLTYEKRLEPASLVIKICNYIASMMHG